MLQQVAWLGRVTRNFATAGLTTFEFVGASIRASASLGRGAREHAFGAAIRQVYFTAVQALPMITSLAFVVGGVVIAMARAQSQRLGIATAVGDLLSTVVVRDLGPLFTAIIVVGRSGTAMASEVASYQALGELRALEALGVDPLQLLVPPRVLACAVSLAILTITFDAVALLGGMVSSQALIQLPPGDYLSSLQNSLTPNDILTVIARAAVLGAGVAGTACYAGLSARMSPAEIPRSATRGVVYALGFVFVASAALTLIPLLWVR